ncbi:hypothetical protein AKO1_010686 [Acrasis kona]|uniref:Protein kinase domain-containing protein n=1 Tax=Acrasis kona TaxID=1008807 RepID=A0AAW2ZL17_9EUKA
MEDYQIYEEIGKGRYSIVYKARKKKTILYNAVKCVDKYHKAKVTNEVKILNMLDHPNVLKFDSWYETNNHYWIIIEFCSGGDLMNLLTQDQALPEDTVHLFSMDLVQGLQYIHSRGVIYCDLKPSNVLIDGCGVLKLSDFGLAQFIRDSELEKDTSSVGRPKRGSPCYMAPELFQGGWHSIYSDFWSLGCVLYELASGSPPFVGQTFELLVDAILNGTLKLT